MDLLQRLLWWLPEEVSSDWTYEVTVDVLVLGGDLQGLCLLESLEEAGYSAVLVAEEPIGAGPIAAWNGVLGSGYGDPDPAVRETIEDDWLPFLDSLDVSHRDEWFAIARDRIEERLHSEWEDFEYPYEPGTVEDLPREWREGDLFEGGTRHGVSEIDEHAVAKSALLAELVERHGDRIVRGEIEGSRRAGEADEIESIEVELPGGDSIDLETEYVVVTAGGRTPEVLATLSAGGTPDGETEPGEASTVVLDHSFRDVHLLVIRAPGGALPETSVHLFPRDLTVAARRESDDTGLGTVTWYVTSESFASTGEGSGRIDPRKVGAGYKELFTLVPTVQERAEAEGSDFEFGVFTGTRYEAEEPYVVESIEGVANLAVAVATPATAWRGVEAVMDRIDGAVEPGEGAVWLPGSVDRSDVQGPRDGTTWLDWDELVVRYPGTDPVSGPPSQ